MYEEIGYAALRVTRLYCCSNSSESEEVASFYPVAPRDSNGNSNSNIFNSTPLLVA